MKIDCHKAKVVCLLIGFLNLLQSCVVYKDVSSTLDEAVESNCKVLVVKKDGEEFKFTKIEKIGNVYYGNLKTKKGTERVLLIEKDLEKIHVLDKRLSTWGDIGIIVGSLGIISVIVGSVANGTDSD